MKRALKVIIPILLLLLILCGVVWYLLAYNPVFLHDLLMDQARSFADNGRYSAAAWCYDQAAALFGGAETPETALELTEHYLKDENYTKAEYTLTKAIEYQPAIELYLRLSQVYVAQDKLLDAEQLIAQVTDPQIKEKLERQRPPVPTADPAPGAYDNYITVSVNGSGGTLYVTNDGSYPSTWGQAYHQPYSLPGGETTLLAMTVGENGLVSPLATLHYTVVGVIEPITLKDSAISTMVYDQLEIPEDKQLYTNDLWQITSFDVPTSAKSIEDLAGMINLENISASYLDLTDSTVFAGLDCLRSVKLTQCVLDAQVLQQLAALPNLTELTLDTCSLSNIEPLAAATGLTKLDLSSNAIRDIEALSVLTDLEYLDLGHNALVSLAGVAGLEHLSYLDVSYNALTSMAPLETCPAMTYLDLSNNQIEALAAVDKMPALETFLASHNAMQTVDLLAGCVNLTKLDVSNNALTDISALSTLVKLTDLSFGNNQVTALPALPKDCALVTINGEHNQLETLDPLADFQHLVYVYMDYNEGIETIDALENCPNLTQVNVYGSQVTDVSALVAHSIIVNYTPIQD